MSLSPLRPAEPGCALPAFVSFPRIASVHPRRWLLRSTAALAASAGLVPALAQSPSLTAEALPAVVVTATRSPTRIDEALAHVTVLDRRDIERAGGRTLAELLARQPDVQIGSNGGFGKTSSVFLRGMEARHTLLLVDGVRLGSATVGIPSFDNLPLDDIERIEIVRGPLSGLYGSDAVGGVIQVFTRSGRAGLQGHGQLVVGSGRHGQLGGGLRFGQGAWSGAVSVQQLDTRGFSSTNPRALFNGHDPDDDGFRQRSASAQLGLQLGAGWRADARLMQAEGRSRYDEMPGTDSLAELDNEVLALDVAGPLTGNWRSGLKLSRSTDGYTTLRTAFGAGNLGRIETVQQQIGWEHNIATPVGTVLLLAERLEQRVARPGAPFDVSERSINALGAGLNGSAGRHGWQFNLRRDANSQFGQQTNGSIGYAYALSPQWRAGASYATSFTAPSFNQLYFPRFGNPDLQPEEGKHAELSLRWTGEGQQLRVVWFDNRVRGYIPSGPAPVNIPRTRIDGVSLAWDARVERWQLSASAEHLDPRNTTPGSPNFGKQLPRRARSALRAGADLDLGAWRLGASFSAYGTRWDNPANTQRVAGHGKLDLRADWRLNPAWTLGLQLNNLGDKDYETVYGYQQPGREAFLSLRYQGR